MGPSVHNKGQLACFVLQRWLSARGMPVYLVFKTCLAPAHLLTASALEQ